MNIVWFCPALVGLLMIVLTVKQSSPPTPPSKSAELNSQYNPECGYLKAIWMLVRNIPCMILTFTIGMQKTIFSPFIFYLYSKFLI
jgi:hypothetical protein